MSTFKIAIWLSLLATQVVAAAPMGIIFVEGDKPARVVYTAEFLNVYSRASLDDLESGKSNIAEMRVIAVYENKKLPESTDMTLEFTCHKNQYRITMAHAMIRDGSEQFPTQNWQSYSAAGSAWVMAAAKVACENEQVKLAAKKTSGQDFSALDKLGILYIGDLDRLQAVDATWKTILADGVRPAYADKKLSDAEIAVYNKKIDEGLANAKKQNEAAMVMATAELGKMKEERKFKKGIAENNKKHTDAFGRESKQFKQLKWILGKTENDIIKHTVSPWNTSEAGGARFLTFYNEYAIDGVGYVEDNNGNYVGTSTIVTCELIIELRRGGSSREYRAVDYSARAENGGCRDLGWFNKAEK